MIESAARGPEVVLRRIQLVLLAFSALNLGLVGACSRQEAAPAWDAADARCEPLARSVPARPRNVVFVLADTTRRDRLGLHGGPADTPRFDAFASEGVFFTAAETQAPWTKPSVATLFTGLPPSRHGVVSHPALRREKTQMESDLLGPEHETLAESLAAAGYQTAAFVSNPWLQRRLGFDQGFETWDESMAHNATPGEVVTAAGLRWLRERGDDPRPYFLYLHYMDAHSPYHAVPTAEFEARREQIAADLRPLTPKARGVIARLARGPGKRPLTAEGAVPNLALFELVYDVGVAHFDRAFGRLLDGLEAQDDWAETAVVVTSDHGEALFERGYNDHGRGLYGDELDVPLAARLPGVSTTGPISCPVGLVDLRRSLCDYLGVECQGDDRGTSVLSDEIAEPGRMVVSEGLYIAPRNRAVRDARHKVMYEPDGRLARGPRTHAGGPWRFYDLVEDPGELRDLVSEGIPEPLRADYERLSAAAKASSAGPRAKAATTLLDDETRRRLEALGYLDPVE